MRSLWSSVRGRERSPPTARESLWAVLRRKIRPAAGSNLSRARVSRPPVRIGHLIKTLRLLLLRHFISFFIISRAGDWTPRASESCRVHCYAIMWRRRITLAIETTGDARQQHQQRQQDATRKRRQSRAQDLQDTRQWAHGRRLIRAWHAICSDSRKSSRALAPAYGLIYSKAAGDQQE